MSAEDGTHMLLLLIAKCECRNPENNVLVTTVSELCYRLTHPHKPTAPTIQDFENTVLTVKKIFFLKSFNLIIKSKGYSLQMHKNIF